MLHVLHVIVFRYGAANILHFFYKRCFFEIEPLGLFSRPTGVVQLNDWSGSIERLEWFTFEMPCKSWDSAKRLWCSTQSTGTAMKWCGERMFHRKSR